MSKASHLGIRRRIALELWRKKRQALVEEHRLRTLFWESTLRCNLRCIHCGSDCKVSATTPDMPAEDFLKAVDSIIPHVDPHRLLVIVSGGEPLMRHDLEHVGLELYRREMPWGIVTNGLALTRERLQRLRRSGLSTISVSLDGLEDDHNWMRGHSQSFRSAVSAIEDIARCPELAWDVITCVNRHNISSIPQLKEMLIAIGVKRWRLFTVFPAGRAARQPDLRLTSDEYRSLLHFISDTRREGRINASYCCEGFLGGFEGDVRDTFYRCNAGVNTASILIDGSISACASIRGEYYQGNIYRDDFMDVWNNRFEKYRNREWMKTGRCADCAMWRYCEGNGMHLRNADGSLMRCNYHELTN